MTGPKALSIQTHPASPAAAERIRIGPGVAAAMTPALRPAGIAGTAASDPSAQPRLAKGMTRRRLHRLAVMPRSGGAVVEDGAVGPVSLAERQFEVEVRDRLEISR